MKVEFMPGIAAISGSTKSKNGNRIIFTHRNGDKPGHGRMYVRPANCYKRTKRVTKKELAARDLFYRRVQLVKSLVAEKHLTKSEAWRIAKDTIKS